jgi:hypothetical protein
MLRMGAVVRAFPGGNHAQTGEKKKKEKKMKNKICFLLGV